jgi:hypothetical protein
LDWSFLLWATSPHFAQAIYCAPGDTIGNQLIWARARLMINLAGISKAPARLILKNERYARILGEPLAGAAADRGAEHLCQQARPLYRDGGSAGAGHDYDHISTCILKPKFLWLRISYFTFLTGLSFSLLLFCLL